MASSSSPISDQQLAEGCYHQWMVLQEQRLNQLMETLTLEPNDPSKEVKLRQVTDRAVQDYQEYIENRAHLFSKGVSKFFAPTWNTSLENSQLWIGGCRPSSFVRLLYALCGAHTIAYVEELLRNAAAAHRSSCGFPIDDLSAEQLHLVNDLQLKTVREEDKLTRRLATLQEMTADVPIATIAQGLSHVRETSEEADRALDEHETQMAELMVEADGLRMTTLLELLTTLTPPQAADFLAASRKLQLCLHEWGKRRDQVQGTGTSTSRFT